MTEEEVQKLVREKFDEYAAEYFAMRRPGFNIESGTRTEGHGSSEFMMTTDSKQGIHFYDTGNCKLAGNKSVEIYGGKTAAEKDEGVVIQAKNGNVHIKAPNGNLILEGTNVIIKATDADGDLNLNSMKTVSVKCPEFIVDATKNTISSTSNTLLAAGTLELYCETGAVTTGSGQDPILSGSFFDKIINIVDKAQKILNRAG